MRAPARGAPGAAFVRAATAGCALLACAPARAQDAAPAWWRAPSVELAAGAGERHQLAQLAAGVELARPSDWMAGALPWLGSPRLRLHAALSGWRVERPDGDRGIVGVGIKPTVIWLRDRWFLEIGIGPTYYSGRYDDGSRRFSTRFQFEDHLAVGWRVSGSLWAALRVQHVSNGGIEGPNPGANTVMLVLRSMRP